MPQRNPDNVISWFEENRNNGYLMILSGMRGTGKTRALEDLSRKLKKEEPGAQVIFFDFEAKANRHVKTCRDVLKIMDLDSRPGTKYVFLDEVGFLPDYRRLLGVLFADKDCRILLSVSNARVLHDDCLSYFAGYHTRFELFPDEKRKRSKTDLESIWNKSLVRDVLGGNTLADSYAEECIAEYLSDTAGAFISSRKVADDVTFAGRKIAHTTAGLYMQHLEDAFLVEKVAQWDAFDCTASTHKFAYFFTDPELREYLFPSGGGDAVERKAITATYAALRRRFSDAVYVARSDDADADFVTWDGHETRFWKADRVKIGDFTEVEPKSPRALKSKCPGAHV